MTRPRWNVISQADDARKRRVVIVHGHTTPLELLAEVASNILLTLGEPDVVAILEQHAEIFRRRHLRDTSAHQPGAEHRNRVDMNRRLAILVLLALGLAVEEAAEGARLGRLRQLTEELRLAPRSCRVARFQARLGTLEDGRRRRVLALRELVHLLRGLVEHDLAADGGLLEEPVHPSQLPRLRLHAARDHLLRSRDRRALKRRRVNDLIHKPHLLRARGLEHLAGEHKVEGVGGTDNLG
mmetsp:Transcript_47196/g.123825  ORF Transcript_47196/g.123825 Transcript_47196/m.123825 type:complete len:240 (-) Transcript_47196:83-802(-)